MTCMYYLMLVHPVPIVPIFKHGDLQAASLACCMGVLDYLFPLLHGHHSQIENIQEDGPMLRAVAKQVELRHHRLKELEACRLGYDALVVVLQQTQDRSLSPLRHLHSNTASQAAALHLQSI